MYVCRLCCAKIKYHWQNLCLSVLMFMCISSCNSTVSCTPMCSSKYRSVLDEIYVPTFVVSIFCSWPLHCSSRTYTSASRQWHQGACIVPSICYMAPVSHGTSACASSVFAPPTTNKIGAMGDMSAMGFTAFLLPGQFAPRNESANRTLANSLPGTFAPGPFRSLAHSLPGHLAPWNFRSVSPRRRYTIF